MLKQHNLDLLSFLSQPLLIDPDVRDFLLAQVASGHFVMAQDWTEDPVHYADPNWAYYPLAEKENSTAILNVPGLLYDYYVNYLCNKLDLIYADPKVTSLVCKLNGPGGAASAGQKLADKLLASPIPTLGYIDYGMAASAHYMIGTACDGFYASRPNDKAGSIGAYISYQNFKKAYEKAGIVSKDLYAKQSTQKNEESRQAEEGDYSLLQKMADDEAARFIDYVKARRPSIDASKQDPFKGRLFNASDALEIGLIDGIGDLKSAVTAVRTTSQTNVTPRKTMLGYVKLGTLVSLKGAEASAFTPEKIEAINTELAAAGFKGIVVVSESEYETAVNAINTPPIDATALATAQADVTRLTTELATATGKVTTLTEERNTLQTQVTKLGGLNGAEKTTVTKDTETQADAGDDDAATIMAGLEHNRQLKDMPWLNK